MRVAALYDIHGNLRALESVLRDVERAGVDVILIGGDVVMGPIPTETLERLNALGQRVRFIRGNTDRNLIEPPRNPDPSPWASSFRWVAERLTAAQREQIATWPETLVLDVDGLGPTLFCHGSPRSDEEIVTPLTSESRLREILAGVSPKLVVHGHTHIRYDRMFESTRLVCPGSVGMPYEGEPGAFWALLGPEVQLRHSIYDFARAADEVRASGFPKAEEFANQNILAPPAPQETAAYFETLAEKKTTKV
jgi:putative phosphoesterase